MVVHIQLECHNVQEFKYFWSTQSLFLCQLIENICLIQRTKSKMFSSVKKLFSRRRQPTQETVERASGEDAAAQLQDVVGYEKISLLLRLQKEEIQDSEVNKRTKEINKSATLRAEHDELNTRLKRAELLLKQKKWLSSFLTTHQHKFSAIRG